jgi:hypothetical protein
MIPMLRKALGGQKENGQHDSKKSALVCELLGMVGTDAAGVREPLCVTLG